MPARQRAEGAQGGVRDRRDRDGPAPRDARPGAASLRRDARPRSGDHEARPDAVRRDVRRATQAQGGSRGREARRGPGPRGHHDQLRRCTCVLLPADSRGPRRGRPAHARHLQPLAGGVQPPGG